MVEKTVELSEAGTHLAELVEEVQNGAHVLLRKGDRLIAEIVPIPPRRRVLGLHKGSIRCSPDFDEPLPEGFWEGR